MHSTESPKLGPSEVEHYMFQVEYGNAVKEGRIKSPYEQTVIKRATKAQEILLAYFDQKYGRLHDVK